MPCVADWSLQELREIDIRKQGAMVPAGVMMQPNPMMMQQPMMAQPGMMQPGMVMQPGMMPMQARVSSVLRTLLAQECMLTCPRVCVAAQPMQPQMVQPQYVAPAGYK